jgi:hypothetical protein
MISQDDLKIKTAEELVRSQKTVEDIVDALVEYCKGLEARIEALEKEIT